MKKLRNKGQDAMEYLMTYGWAILMVIVVGIVLWQLGFFSEVSVGTSSMNYTKICKEVIPYTTNAEYVGKDREGCELYMCEFTEQKMIEHNNETLNVTLNIELGTICI